MGGGIERSFRNTKLNYIGPVRPIPKPRKNRDAPKRAKRYFGYYGVVGEVNAAGQRVTGGMALRDAAKAARASNNRKKRAVLRLQNARFKNTTRRKKSVAKRSAAAAEGGGYVDREIGAPVVLPPGSENSN